MGKLFWFSFKLLVMLVTYVVLFLTGQKGISISHKQTLDSPDTLPSHNQNPGTYQQNSPPPPNEKKNMSLKEGTILKGKGSSYNHHFSGAILVFWESIKRQC